MDNQTGIQSPEDIIGALDEIKAALMAIFGIGAEAEEIPTAGGDVVAAEGMPAGMEG